MAKPFVMLSTLNILHCPNSFWRTLSIVIVFDLGISDTCCITIFTKVHKWVTDFLWARFAIRTTANNTKQEDLLDLITALLKFNCFLSTTVATQCIFQSNL